MPDAAGTTLHFDMAAPAAFDEQARSDLARLATRLCDAEAAGVAPREAAVRSDLGTLAERIAGGGACATVDRRDGTYLAGAAIVGSEAMVLWIERRSAPFDRPALARLDWLAAGGVRLLDALDAERAQSELLLNEARHRCANDLHLVGSLLSHHARFAAEARVAAVLEIVAGRVMILARARQQSPGDLIGGLRACADALAAQVGTRGIEIRVRVDGACPPIDHRRAAILLLAANELAVNALKHGFAEDRNGIVELALAASPAGIVLTVDDNGSPLPGRPVAIRPGSGLDLIGRLVAGIRATLKPPPPGSKRFTIEMKLAPATTHGRDR